MEIGSVSFAAWLWGLFQIACVYQAVKSSLPVRYSAVCLQVAVVVVAFLFPLSAQR